LLANAYTASKNYLTFARGLLSNNSWETNYNLTLEIYQLSAEVAYLCTEFDRLNRFTEIVLQQGKTVLDKVKIYQVKVQAFIAQHQLLEAINTALEILELLGINFPANPTQEDIQKAFQDTELMLTGKNILDLIDLPLMNDPEKIAAIFILALIIAASYSAFPQLLPLIVIKQVQLSIQYGNATVSTVAYSSYGFILCGVIGDIDTGYEWGKLALNLLNKLDVKEFKAKTFNMVYLLINHWKSHTKNSLPYLKEAYQSGLETGDLEFALITIHGYCYNSWLIGKELNQVDQEIILYTEPAKQFKNELVITWQNLWHQTVLNLLGKGDDLCRLIGTSFNVNTMLSVLHEAKNGAGLYVLYCNQLMLSYLFYEYQQAVENGTEAEKYLINVTSLSTVPLFYFYDSLAQLAIYDQVDKTAQKVILQRVKTHQKNMKKWCFYSPMNYLHKYYLVEAEKYRVLGKNGGAREMYDRAIALAKQNEYLHEEALANELATKFYLSIGKDKIAHVYFNDAYYCYTRWGATAKITHLENTYPQFLSQSKVIDNNTITTRTTISNNSENNLDISTVFKASQAISGEIILDKLLDYLMRILIQSAGAQKGFILLKDQNDKFLIEAKGFAESEQVTILHSIDMENSQEMAINIIQYTARTNKIVLLNDARNEGQFTQDEYIKQNQIKSILCAPLINQGILTGIVYLENNLTTGAFTNERLEIVQLLSTQAAIAISNAKLYSQVRESENRLTQLLETMPIGIFVIDANYQPYYLNSWAEKLLGKGIITDINPIKLREVYQVYLAGTEDIYPLDRDPVFRAFQGESVNVDDLEIHRGNDIIPLEVWANPIYNVQGSITYVILAFIDITERKKAEAEKQDFISQLFDANINLELALESESQLTNAAKRFVPNEFLALLGKESIVEIELGDNVELEMSVLFSDIRDFTSLSEKMTPAENFKFINSYLSRMETVITQNNGFIDKYIGDAIMALFNGSADDAVIGGIDMLNQIILYNQHRANFDYPPIGIGIGINTGLLMLGTVGSENRMDTTVISDAVNLASRVESLTKNYGVNLLITHQTFFKLQNPDKYHIREIDTVQVKGKSEWITIYEVFDADLPEIRQAKLLTKRDFEQALLLYKQQKYTEALKGFEHCLSVNKYDKVAQIYLQRCHFSNQ
ncbi:MAG TPA: adenylate/guanylate cyclase domain-containing protein, partial [Allocoleopsis sp.]